ncbi:MAG: type II toxin-antitoxin system Phd/YefM family antitoxin [Coriobacteriales bacterium]|jgi:PHD/YefM family antitoxin component YafN of YafNO toxin-antitoxin module|nr:type II toxin-antitoxin system Phd/YefM family antitoxin [Coriobacteriales bacterium]
MPVIKSSTDLRNGYNEISEFCKESAEPVFITRNGQGDLAVMSIEYYEALIARQELYGMLDAGAKDIREGRCKPFSQAIDLIREDLACGAL